MALTRVPESRNESWLNASRVSGAMRTMLPSSNSTSARPPFLVSRTMPSVTGMFMIAFSNPSPVCRSILTVPSTLLKRTMRACDSASAGRTAQHASSTNTTSPVASFRVDIKLSPWNLPQSIRTRFLSASCTNADRWKTVQFPVVWLAAPDAAPGDDLSAGCCCA